MSCPNFTPQVWPTQALTEEKAPWGRVVLLANPWEWREQGQRSPWGEEFHSGNAPELMLALFRGGLA